MNGINVLTYRSNNGLTPPVFDLMYRQKKIQHNNSSGQKLRGDLQQEKNASGQQQRTIEQRKQSERISSSARSQIRPFEHPSIRSMEPAGDVQRGSEGRFSLQIEKTFSN